MVHDSKPVDFSRGADGLTLEQSIYRARRELCDIAMTSGFLRAGRAVIEGASRSVFRRTASSRTRPLAGLIVAAALGAIAMTWSSMHSRTATTGVAPADITACSGARSRRRERQAPVRMRARSPDAVRCQCDRRAGRCQHHPVNGLIVQTTLANGINFTNSGILSSTSGAGLQLIGNGGVSYTGTGALSGVGGNSPGVDIRNLNGGTGAPASTPSEAASRQAARRSASISRNATGGITYTTSSGHTSPQATGRPKFRAGHRDRQFCCQRRSTVNSGSTISVSGSIGPVFAFDINSRELATSASQSAAVNLSRRPRSVFSAQLSIGASDNATFNLNGASRAAAATGQGLTIDFQNAASTGVGAFTVSNNDARRIELWRAYRPSGGGAAETHQVTVTAGSTISAGTSPAAMRWASRASARANLTNGGLITSVVGNAIDVAGFRPERIREPLVASSASEPPRPARASSTPATFQARAARALPSRHWQHARAARDGPSPVS